MRAGGDATHVRYSHDSTNYNFIAVGYTCSASALKTILNKQCSASDELTRLERGLGIPQQNLFSSAYSSGNWCVCWSSPFWVPYLNGDYSDFKTSPSTISRGRSLLPWRTSGHTGCSFHNPSLRVPRSPSTVRSCEAPKLYRICSTSNKATSSNGLIRTQSSRTT